MRVSVNADQALDLHLQPRFFQDFTGTSLCYAFTGFHIAARHVPSSVVSAAHEKNALTVRIKNCGRASNSQTPLFADALA